MGQIVIGVMLGVPVPEQWWDGEERYEQYHSAVRGAIADVPHSTELFRAGRQYIGFYLGVHGGDTDHGPCLNLATRARTIRQLKRTKAYARAERRWSRFAAWATERGIQLPKPRLVIAPVEVA